MNEYQDAESLISQDTISVTHLIMLLSDEYENLVQRHNSIQNLACRLAHRIVAMYYQRLMEIEKDVGFQATRPIPYVRWDSSNPASQTRIYWRKSKYIFDPEKRTNLKNHSGSSLWAYKDIPSPRKEKYGVRAFVNAKCFVRNEVRDLAVETEEVLFLLRRLVSDNRRIKNSNIDRLNEIEKIKRVAEAYEDETI